jgi:hypothetical protein
MYCAVVVSMEGLAETSQSSSLQYVQLCPPILFVVGLSYCHQPSPLRDWVASELPSHVPFALQQVPVSHYGALGSGVATMR